MKIETIMNAINAFILTARISKNKRTNPITAIVRSIKLSGADLNGKLVSKNKNFFSEILSCSIKINASLHEHVMLFSKSTQKQHKDAIFIHLSDAYLSIGNCNSLT
jgi:hypothetical protein